MLYAEDVGGPGQAPTYLCIWSAGKEAAVPPDTDSLNVWEAITTRKKSPRKEIILNIGRRLKGKYHEIFIFRVPYMLVSLSFLCCFQMLILQFFGWQQQQGESWLTIQQQQGESWLIVQQQQGESGLTAQQQQGESWLTVQQ